MSLCGVLIFRRAELACSSSLLLEMLLLFSVGVADLDGVFLSVDHHWGVVEGLDDFFADVA